MPLSKTLNSCQPSLAAPQVTSESPGEAENFSSGINTVSTTFTFLTLLALVIMKRGVKTDKQAAFLWRARGRAVQ